MPLEANLIQRAHQLSPFFDRQLEQHPEWLERLSESEPEAPSGGPHFDARLRHWRNRQQLRHILADLSGSQSVEAGLRSLSDTADSAIQQALAHHQARLEELHGTPRNRDGAAQALSVLAMGKLGGRELNFSSDVDLVFVYGESGETDGRRRIENQRFFTLLAQATTASLNEITEAGFVYRVDTRLRPFGSAGALVQNLTALENYFQREGRDWERYAWIKARGVAGDSVTAAAALTIAQPFVYRRYVDYSVLEALRNMHRSVLQQARARDQLEDLKRGPGGIRALEFMVQSQQLLRGGREPSLQVPGFLSALRALIGTGDFDRASAAVLTEDYLSLRQLENRIQALHDQQTHRLPERREDRQRLLAQYQVNDWERFVADIRHIRDRVSEHFQNVAGEPAPAAQNAGDPPGSNALWQQLRDWQKDSTEDLEHPLWNQLDEDIRKGLLHWLPSFQRLPLSDRGRGRLDRLMPQLLERLTAENVSAATADRLWRLLQKISRRSAYLVLLAENPAATGRLISLLSRSGYLAEQVTQYPALLDELIDPVLSSHLADSEELADSVRRQVIDEPEPEKALERLAYLRLSHTFRAGVSVLEATAPADQITRALATMAQLTVRACLQLAQRDRETVPLSVIAYGALGAEEMHFGSDLDLVFLHADGADPVVARKQVQRLTNLLAIPTGSGKLYAVDSRLRPNGQAGLLVSSLTAFSRYQTEQAWTWEHQALTRARWIAGSDDEDLGSSFRQIRRAVLTDETNPEAIRKAVVEMRHRMRRERPSDSPLESLKQAAGGLLDLQFLVQAGLLVCAPDEPDVVMSHRWPEQLSALVRAGWLNEEPSEHCRSAWQLALLQLLQSGMGMDPQKQTPSKKVLEIIEAKLPGLLEL